MGLKGLVTIKATESINNSLQSSAHQIITKATLRLLFYMSTAFCVAVNENEDMKKMVT